MTADRAKSEMLEYAALAVSPRYSETLQEKYLTMAAQWAAIYTALFTTVASEPKPPPHP